MHVNSGLAGTAHYFQEIRRFPMLNAEEEYVLAKRWREHSDDSAAEKLVTSHLRLAAKIAGSYRGYGLPIQDSVLRSWSLVKVGTTANQKKLFFNLRKAKSRISALDEGNLHPDQVKIIAKRLGATGYEGGD